MFSATAYQWIAPTAQLDRPAELLKPGALVAIVDLIQVDSPTDHGFFAAAQPIYERYLSSASSSARIGPRSEPRPPLSLSSGRAACRTSPTGRTHRNADTNPEIRRYERLA